MGNAASDDGATEATTAGDLTPTTRTASGEKTNTQKEKEEKGKGKDEEEEEEEEEDQVPSNNGEGKAATAHKNSSDNDGDDVDNDDNDDNDDKARKMEVEAIERTENDEAEGKENAGGTRSILTAAEDDNHSTDTVSAKQRNLGLSLESREVGESRGEGEKDVKGAAATDETAAMMNVARKDAPEGNVSHAILEIPQNDDALDAMRNFVDGPCLKKLSDDSDEMTIEGQNIVVPPTPQSPLQMTLPVCLPHSRVHYGISIHHWSGKRHGKSNKNLPTVVQWNVRVAPDKSRDAPQKDPVMARGTLRPGGKNSDDTDNDKKEQEDCQGSLFVEFAPCVLEWHVYQEPDEDFPSHPKKPPLVTVRYRLVIEPPSVAPKVLVEERLQKCRGALVLVKEDCEVARQEMQQAQTRVAACQQEVQKLETQLKQDLLPRLEQAMKDESKCVDIIELRKSQQALLQQRIDEGPAEEDAEEAEAAQNANEDGDDEEQEDGDDEKKPVLIMY